MSNYFPTPWVSPSHQVIEQAKGGVLFVDEAYRLLGKVGDRGRGDEREG